MKCLKSTNTIDSLTSRRNVFCFCLQVGLLWSLLSHHRTVNYYWLIEQRRDHKHTIYIEQWRDRFRVKVLGKSTAVAGRGVSFAFPRVRMATRAELDRRAHAGEVVVPGGAGGHSLEAQEHLAEGRHKGGETRAHQLGHEGYVEMGKKGGLAGHGADPYQAAVKHGVHIDEHKFMNEASIEELDRRAREGEVIVPGGTGGHSLEAQKHLAEGRYKGGVTRAQQLGHEGYVEIGRKEGQA